MDYNTGRLYLARLRHWAFERRQHERFDRWCHGGVVSFRLPFMTRLDADSRFRRDPRHIKMIVP